MMGMHTMSAALVTWWCALVAVGGNVVEATLGPVVIVPGTASSTIQARIDKPTTTHFYCQKKSGWFDLWLSIPELLPPMVNCWVDNARLLYDPESRTYRNNEGVETRVQNFGSTKGFLHVGTVKVFDRFVKALESSVGGLVQNKTVRGSPYDFRYGPKTNFDGEWVNMMIRLVEETYANAGQAKVTIVSHSLGCPMSLYFFNHVPQSWKDQYIRQWVPTAGVFGGTGEGIEQLLSGISAGTLAPAKTLRVEQRSWESSMVLAPTPLAFGDRVLVTTPSRNYTASDYEALLDDAAGMKYGNQRIQDAYHLVGHMQHPGVNIHHMYGVGIPTPTTYTYNVDTGFDAPPTVHNDDGDGTVAIDSLRLPEKQWATKAAAASRFPFTAREFPGKKHSEIIDDDEWIQAVMELLK